MNIGLIWAQAHSRAIGRQSTIPWHLPEDVAHFKELTIGHPVIMGSKTWLSLPEQFRPLNGRTNLIVTRNAQFVAPGAVVVATPEEAIAHAASLKSQTAWVIGGGQLYAEVMHLADIIELTQIDLDVPDADTYAPEIPANFQLVSSSDTMVSSTGLNYRFERWQRAHDTLEK